MLITFTFGGGSSFGGGAADAVSTGGAALALGTGAGVASGFGGDASVVCGGADSEGCFEHANEKRRRKSPFGRIVPRVSEFGPSPVRYASSAPCVDSRSWPLSS